MRQTTLIKGADWAIAWDAAAGQHVYRRAIDVAFTEDHILHVGPGFTGAADQTLDGRDLMVMPGLVDVHSHLGHEPVYRGIREEHGLPSMYMTGLYERSQAFDTTDPDLRCAATEVALCELLKSGVTSICDISSPYEGWSETIAKSGVRGFLAPGFASARWRLENGHSLGFAWDEAAGRRGLDTALALIDSLPAHPSGRLSGVVSPMQIENCTDDLLRDSRAAALERGTPFTLHLAQGVLELQEMTRRHGVTSIRHAADLGILGPGTILGHAIFLDTHSWIRGWTRDDLRLLAESGCAVAHCPTPFARYGHLLESFGAYVRAGITMALGTDTSPHNMLEEIRKAGTLSRIAARDITDVSTGMLFHAATVGGAKSLLRDDLGRLAVGTRADVVLVDLKQPDMMPARDPLRSLVFHAADRAVRHVFVAGRQVVADGQVVHLDHRAAAERLTEAQVRMMALCPARDYRGRAVDELTPLSLPMDGCGRPEQP
ncbi:amidohydrolase family protein [Methylobacterium sp. J-077]|uniref:amidohydrolase family protein n=1 Tax=Methylobacterium sp. J-077 TaxID=2836656 RepID=UPI001FB920BD|nr:amidohydrolase family protein [Methylobacterium sp. J-077]MCJ2126957.1 amidohydrolase family protein [Methylobacterium sp. J-077]